MLRKAHTLSQLNSARQSWFGLFFLWKLRMGVIHQQSPLCFKLWSESSERRGCAMLKMARMDPCSQTHESVTVLLSDKSNRRAFTPSQSTRECREILDIPYYKVQYNCWCTVIKESMNGAMARSHIRCIRWGWGFVWRRKLQHYQTNNLKSLVSSINTPIHVKGGYNVWPLWKPTRKLLKKSRCQVWSWYSFGQ